MVKVPRISVRNIMVGVVAATAALAPIAVAAPAAEAAGSVRSAVSLTAPASGAYGSTITLRGTLWRYGTSTRIANALVYLQRSPHGRGTWANLKSTRTSSTGGFAFSVVQVGAYDYRAYFAGSPTYTRALSAVRYPVTLQKVLHDTMATTDYGTGALRATGRVYPAPPTGTAVYLQHWLPDRKTWQSIGSGRTSGSNVTITAKQPGSVQAYRLYVPWRYPYGYGASPARRFAHYVWRGIFTKPIVTSGGRGSHDIWGEPESPDRSTVTVHALSNGEYHLGMDSAGCSRVSAAVQPRADTTAQVDVGFATDTRWLDRATIAPGSPAWSVQAVLNSGESVLWFQVGDQGSSTGSHVEAGIYVLCAN